jgi:osmotically-inducible protein OsmY
VVNEIEVRPSRTTASAEIRTGIEAALKRSAEVEARRIHVDIQGPTVVLTGTVSSWPERNGAERAAWAAPRVSKIENKLLISSAMVTARLGLGARSAAVQVGSNRAQPMFGGRWP